MGERSRPSEEFYIGYLPQAPAGLARWMRSRLVALFVVLVALSLALVAGMARFPRADFEFGNLREFSGRLELDPYPVLWVARPGDTSQLGPGVSAHSTYLLVAEGKFGAGPELAEFAGQTVRLRGTLIHRDGRTMVEVVPDSVEAAEPLAAAAQGASPVDLGTRELRGEIVDSKCFLGVMKPGNLKPHRACATRCIAGGVPPVLAVLDAEGRADYYLLLSPEGQPVGADVLGFVAEPVSVTGRVERRGDLTYLYADPDEIQRLP